MDSSRFSVENAAREAVLDKMPTYRAKKPRLSAHGHVEIAVEGLSSAPERGLRVLGDGVERAGAVRGAD